MIKKEKYNKTKKAYLKKYYIENIEKIKEYKRLYYLKNKEKIKQNSKRNRSKNKAKRNIRERQRFKKDVLYKIKIRNRKIISQAFKRKSAGRLKKSEEILGCSFEFFKKYIEERFKPGMNWDNYGKWHLDHIKPLATAKTSKELEKLCHYTNLQPLWAHENLSKGSKI